MNYYAHSTVELERTLNQNKGNWQLLWIHLREVAELAASFAESFNASEYAKLAGYLHDIGKYRAEFQEYLEGKRKGGEDTHHAVYGAAVACKFKDLVTAFVIAGHHSGLHDSIGLQELLRKQAYGIFNNSDNIVEKLIDKLNFECGDVLKEFTQLDFSNERTTENKLRLELFIRMVFSCLVDADFINTEAFYNGHQRVVGKTLDKENLSEELLLKLDQAINKKSGKKNKINEIRNSIYTQCKHKAKEAQGFFSLTVPTGGGKTLSGMAFALEHAKKHKLKRVIVVIPYLTIIEQNAAEYRRIFDPINEGLVVENHSAVEVKEGENEERSQLELAAENWDSPIVVTTSVQFIESLFANKPSKCRKLHNIANSVVLFDEVQTLPTHLLNPLLNIWRDLQKNYNVSFVFSSATQPAFKKQDNLVNGFNDNEIKEITENTSEIFRELCRVKYQFPRSDKSRTWEDLAEEIIQNKQVLCVVNTRKQALNLWQTINSKLSGEQKKYLFHLSSAMCAEHRLNIIGGKDTLEALSIKSNLLNNMPCYVVSTQLIEAGVDIDFPVVFRAIGPLDSIVQTAGRCNREGKLKTNGRVVVFKPEENILPPGIYKLATEVASIFLNKQTNESLAVNPIIFKDYFTRLYGVSSTDFQKKGEDNIQTERSNLNFREVANKTKVIDQNGKSVIVPFGGEQGPAMKIINEIRQRDVSKEKLRFSRVDMRKLQRFFVNLRNKDFQILQSRGQIEQLLPNLDINVLNIASYDNNLGVLVNERSIEDFIL